MRNVPWLLFCFFVPAGVSSQAGELHKTKRGRDSSCQSYMILRDVSSHSALRPMIALSNLPKRRRTGRVFLIFNFFSFSFSFFSLIIFYFFSIFFFRGAARPQCKDYNVVGLRKRQRKRATCTPDSRTGHEGFAQAECMMVPPFFPFFFLSFLFYPFFPLSAAPKGAVQVGIVCSFVHEVCLKTWVFFSKDFQDGMQTYGSGL